MPQPRKPNASGPPPQRKSGQPKTPARTRTAGQAPPPPAPPQGQFEVDLPAGGRLRLQNAEEVQAWEEASRRYIEDYGLNKANDLMLLGAILSQAIAMFRAQQDLADGQKAIVAQGIIIKASGEIRDLEKALGIDKKTREAGGQHDVRDYVTRLKRAAHAKGVHLAERLKRYEAFNMELRWKIRLLRNGDDEDRRHHGLTMEAIVAWAEQELAKLEEKDKEWAHQVGKVFAGRL